MTLAMQDGVFHEVTSRYSGVSVLLHFRRNSGCIKEGQETLFICPGDNQAINPTTPQQQQAYDALDLNDPRNNMCSYAVRDFLLYPLDPDAETPQIIACDRMGLDGRTAHHSDGLCVLFDDGAVKFMSREDLGLSRDDPIVVGPRSTHPMLGRVRYHPRPHWGSIVPHAPWTDPFLRRR